MKGFYPVFRFHTKRAIDGMSKEKKKECALISTLGYETKYQGFAYSHPTASPDCSAIVFPSQLCLRTPELATYCGDQFISLWMDLCLPKDGKITSNNRDRGEIGIEAI